MTSLQRLIALHPLIVAVDVNHRRTALGLHTLGAEIDAALNHPEAGNRAIGWALVMFPRHADGVSGTQIMGNSDIDRVADVLGSLAEILERRP